MPDRHYIALLLTAFVIDCLWVPAMFLVVLCGLVGAMDLWLVPPLLDILPLEKWPMAARIAYGLLHL